MESIDEYRHSHERNIYIVFLDTLIAILKFLLFIVQVYYLANIPRVFLEISTIIYIYIFIFLLRNPKIVYDQRKKKKKKMSSPMNQSNLARSASYSHLLSAEISRA